MESQGIYELDGGGAAGLRLTKEDEANLSEIIEVLNKKFFTEFSDADKLYFEQIKADLINNESLRIQAQNNSLDNFQYGFKDKFWDAWIERNELNGEIFATIMNNTDLGDKVLNYFMTTIYNQFRSESTFQSKQ
jgi:type I restriction enzyme R subunit